MDFVSRIIRIPRSQHKGHVVIAPPANTDFSVCGSIVSAFLVCFQTTARDFVDALPRRISHTGLYRESTTMFHMAVSASLALEMPTLPQLLRCIAQAPGSCLRFYLSERKLHKFSRGARKTRATEPGGEFFKRHVF